MIEPLLARFEGAQDLSIGEGWYPLVAQLDRDLAAIDPSYVLHQVKQKFGSLRYYYGSSLEYTSPNVVKMRSLVAEAEDASTRICEVCGQPGSTATTSWIQTLCPTHAERRPAR